MDLQVPVQSVPITTKVVSSNPIHGKVYSIQHYMIKFVSDLSVVTGWWFSLGDLVSSTNKSDCHNITEILLKVVLITIIKPNLKWNIITLSQRRWKYGNQRQHTHWIQIAVCVKTLALLPESHKQNLWTVKIASNFLSK
jgi:hypothetical protein